MNKRIKITFISLIAVSATLILGPAAFAQRDIGVGEVNVQRDVVPVVTRSQDGEALKILKTAFSIHGRYRVANSMQEASFAIQVDPVGSSHSTLKIFSGIPERLQYTTQVQGDSRRNSILKAVDLAIYKTSGMQGFFAGKIAYVGEVGRGMEIYYRDFLFGEGKRLTSHGVEAVRPRWSPDGNYIVYTSYLSGFPNIRRIDIRGQRSEVMVDFKGTNTSARYSPDGTRLAMVLTGPGNADIYVGSSLAKGLKRIVNSDGLEATPCWSRDGREIIFASDRNGGLALYRGSAAGGRFSHIPTQISGYCAEPDWNHADPDLIAFTVGVGNRFQVATYRFSTRKSEFLTNERGDGLQPCWLNDGRHLIYTSRNGSDERIVLFDTVTKKRSVLSPAGLGKVNQASFLPPRG
jgi:TolB protein